MIKHQFVIRNLFVSMFVHHWKVQPRYFLMLLFNFILKNIKRFFFIIQNANLFIS